MLSHYDHTSLKCMCLLKMVLGFLNLCTTVILGLIERLGSMDVAQVQILINQHNQKVTDPCIHKSMYKLLFGIYWKSCLDLVPVVWLKL